MRLLGEVAKLHQQKYGYDLLQAVPVPPIVKKDKPVQKKHTMTDHVTVSEHVENIYINEQLCKQSIAKYHSSNMIIDRDQAFNHINWSEDAKKKIDLLRRNKKLYALQCEFAVRDELRHMARTAMNESRNSYRKAMEKLFLYVNMYGYMFDGHVF